MGKWICCQIGAREHYAIPRALHREERLAGLYTDVWAGGRLMRIADGKWRMGRTLAGRFHPELAGAKVVAWNWKSIIEKLKAERLKAEKGEYEGFIEMGRRFAMRVRDEVKTKLKAESGKLKEDCLVFAYDTGALESFEWCREQVIKTVLGQMDPSRVEVELVRAEAKRWPGWQSQEIEVPEEYFQRREREWALADRVMVNSEFCRQALIQQGVSEKKLVVVPLCYENAETLKSGKGERAQSVSAFQRFSVSALSPLRVLFLGQVILRKGIQYLIEAARLLEGEPVRVEVVGPVGISEDAVGSAPANLRFHGRATRDQAGGWYEKADVFVLPTLSDGFALTQLEAMAHGLPVIATPNCGEVVSDGVDGFIVPVRDAQALARAILAYVTSPDLLREHQAAARRKSEQFSLARLGERLIALEAQI